MRMERTATVTAMTTCVVASCDRETFDELLRPLYVVGLTASPAPRSRRASESSGQATFAQSPNLRVVSAAQAMPRSGSTQRNVPLPPKCPNVARRGERARPVALLRSLQLDAEAPVQRAEAAEVGQHAVEARELDGDHLGVRLGRDERAARAARARARARRRGRRACRRPGGPTGRARARAARRRPRGRSPRTASRPARATCSPSTAKPSFE